MGHARFYSPTLGRFTQPDTLIPGTDNPQVWNRFSYVMNNPARYTDPTGHMVVSECSELAGGCDTTQKDIDDDKRKEEEFRRETDYRKCQGGDYAYCSPIDLLLMRHPKPVFGFHVGYAGQAGYWLESGGYTQWDWVVDWNEGKIYTVKTVGGSLSGGAISGLEGEVYAGISVVHGIPGDAKDITGYLEGTQFDLTLNVNADAGLLAGGAKGVSVDLDPVTHEPVYNLGAGYNYTTESSIVFGGNEIPNGGDFSIEGGLSESFVTDVNELPWSQ